MKKAGDDTWWHVLGVAWVLLLTILFFIIAR